MDTPFPFTTLFRSLFQLLLPFAAGHLLRPLIGDWVTAHKRLVSVSDRGSILLVVYTAFSAAVVEGLWHCVAPAELLVLTVCCIGLLAAILNATWLLGRLVKPDRADAIVLQFCGSKKHFMSGGTLEGLLLSVP